MGFTFRLIAPPAETLMALEWRLAIRCRAAPLEGWLMGDYDDGPTVIFRNSQFPSAFD